MIIIVDSIDRVGKTTLCNKLAESLNAKIYKHSEGHKRYCDMTDENETSTMIAMLDLYKLYPENKIIFDRFHLSNTIYGVLQRGYDIKNAIDNFKSIDSVLSNLDNVVLIKVNPTDINRSNNEHGSDLSEHLNMFNKLYNFSNIKNKFECDYNSIDDTVNKINNLFKSK